MNTEALGYKEYKCPRCGWLHAALPIAAIPELTAMYLRCFSCKAPTAGFTPAGPVDVPVGCTLQPAFVPGAWP
jgi:hypothetical protein